jgi:heme/copper-type cytochrome/quinol oxidase subunit 2
MKHPILTLILFFTLIGQAAAQAPAMAEGLRSDGKIYVVVGVVVLIFLVLFAYLTYLDFRLRKAEKEVKASNK